MKRQRDNEGLENIDSANCLILLSSLQKSKKPLQKNLGPVEFECKTCKKRFSSFQALGGHRTSHKRPKLDGKIELKAHTISLSLGNKPKKHECSVCGRNFSIGQALGGHMRKHRAIIKDEFTSMKEIVAKVPVLKRSNSTRVMCLDLNLTPIENDLKLLFGKSIGC